MINQQRKNLPNKISKSFYHLNNYNNSKSPKKDSESIANMIHKIKILSHLPLTNKLMMIMKTLNNKNSQDLRYKMMTISKKKKKNFNKKRKAKNSKTINKLISLSKKWKQNKLNKKKRKNNKFKFNQISLISSKKNTKKKKKLKNSLHLKSVKIVTMIKTFLMVTYS